MRGPRTPTWTPRPRTGSAPRRPPTAITLAFVVALGCGSTSRRVETEEPLPDALRPFAQGYEVTPFDGYQVQGVALFRTMPDDDPAHAAIVGVEEGSGQLLERAALFLRAQEGRSAAERAVIAIDTLLGRQGATPLDPSTASLADADRGLIEPPTLDEETLRFYLDDPTSREVARFEITLGNGRVQIQSLRELRAAMPFCTPALRCGCWGECMLVHHLDGQQVEVVGTGETRVLSQVCDHRDPPQCAQVCEADGSCHEPYALLQETCTEACPPTVATFRCERDGDTCRRVER